MKSTWKQILLNTVGLSAESVECFGKESVECFRYNQHSIKSLLFFFKNSLNPEKDTEEHIYKMECLLCLRKLVWNLPYLLDILLPKLFFKCTYFEAIFAVVCSRLVNQPGFIVCLCLRANIQTIMGRISPLLSLVMLALSPLPPSPIKEERKEIIVIVMFKSPLHYFLNYWTECRSYPL